MRATKPGLADPCWDGGHDLLPVLPCLRTFLRRQGHGASRATSVEKRPVLVPPGYPGLPSGDTFLVASSRRSTCTSRRTKRRMRPFVPRVLGLVTRCSRFDCVSRRHSPPWRPPDIRCHRRGARRGRKPAARSSDRPRSALRLRSAKSAAFQQARMPFTISTHEGIVVRRRDCSLRPSCRLSRSRRPLGHCKITVRSPAGSVTGFGSTDAFSTRWDSRAWD